jgi:hypothetical protein
LQLSDERGIVVSAHRLRHPGIDLVIAQGHPTPRPIPVAIGYECAISPARRAATCRSPMPATAQQTGAPSCPALGTKNVRR